MVSTQRKNTDSLRVYNTFWDIGNMPIKCLSVHITATITEDSQFFSPTLHSYTDTESTIYTTNLLVVIPREPFKIPRCYIHTTLCLLYMLEDCKSISARLLVTYNSHFSTPSRKQAIYCTVLYLRGRGERAVALYDHQGEPNASLASLKKGKKKTHTLPGKNPVYFWGMKISKCAWQQVMSAAPLVPTVTGGLFLLR